MCLLSFGAKWIMMLTLMINICLLSVKVTLNGYDVNIERGGCPTVSAQLPVIASDSNVHSQWEVDDGER